MSTRHTMGGFHIEIIFPFLNTVLFAGTGVSMMTKRSGVRQMEVVSNKWAFWSKFSGSLSHAVKPGDSNITPGRKLDDNAFRSTSQVLWLHSFRLSWGRFWKDTLALPGLSEVRVFYGSFHGPREPSPDNMDWDACMKLTFLTNDWSLVQHTQLVASSRVLWPI